ncbi:hypothetical protein FRC04_002901 [Tulasnella sp. 424]|nr:hypothetical protein FRC04_002901 [Tulasnella sp. 424]KAG8981253.1 hypothetical protein FRC05_004155 [Tulasnella sp. 425]
MKRPRSSKTNRQPVSLEPAGNGTDKRLVGLHDLPVELLYEILQFSVNPSFTLVSRYMHLVFKSTSPHFRAEYIIQATESLAEEEAYYLGAWWKFKLRDWLRYGVCDFGVLQLLIKQTQPPKTIIISSPGGVHDKIELPKRILRSFSSAGSESKEVLVEKDAAAMSFLRYLLGPIELQAPIPVQKSQSEHHRSVTICGDPDSHQGYYLARAVHLNHEPLIDLLLKHGADPLQKSGIAIKFAIKRKDERMVRKLISKCFTPEVRFIGEELLKYSVKVDARDIALFFIREKRVAPTLETLKLLQ